MSAPFVNAIAWAQFRLLGGWKNTLVTGVAYAAILAATMFGVTRALITSASVTFSSFVALFIALQVLAVVVYGTLRVNAAVRADVSSRVIESHRLMPLGSGSAILGYLLGAPIQALGLFAINVLLGMVAVAGASLPLQSWFFANMVLLAFGVFLWTIVAFFAFRTAWVTPAVIFGPVVGGTMGGAWMLVVLLPGVSVLLTPMIGHTVFDMRTGLTVEWTHAAGIGLQTLIGGLYFAAAARRYRSDGAVGFTTIMGLLLLTAWVASSVLGLEYQREFQHFPFRFEMDRQPAFIATFSSVLLLAILPVASATRLVDSAAPGGRAARLIAWGAVLAASIICLVVVIAASPVPATSNAVARTAIVVAAFLMSIRYLLGVAYRKRWRSRRLVFGWLLLTWFVPVLIDLLRIGMDSGDQHLGQIAFCSPPAEVFEIWSRDPAIHSTASASLAVQCLLAALLAGIYHGTNQRRSSTSTPAPATPSQPL